MAPCVYEGPAHVPSSAIQFSERLSPEEHSILQLTQLSTVLEISPH